MRIEIYNVLGQRVRTLVNEEKVPGYYTVDFDAGRLASGFYIYGSRFGLVNFFKDPSLLNGGVVYTRLPDDGIDLTNASYRIRVDGEFAAYPQAPRFAARDADGDWAFFSVNIPDNQEVTQALSAGTWVVPDARYGLQAGPFDATRVTAVGVACLFINRNNSARSMLMSLDEFELFRAASTPPSVSRPAGFTALNVPVRPASDTAATHVPRSRTSIQAR